MMDGQTVPDGPDNHYLVSFGKTTFGVFGDSASDAIAIVREMVENDGKYLRYENAYALHIHRGEGEYHEYGMLTFAADGSAKYCTPDVRGIYSL